MRRWLKHLWLRLTGKQEHAVVVSFASGAPEKVEAMVREVRALLPDREHFLIPREAGSALALWWRWRRRLSRYRIGMAPVLFDGDARFRAMRLAAFLLAPLRILAYNRRLERHHLHPRCWLASLLFWRGVPLDRIWLRPAWLSWTTHDRTAVPDDAAWIEGRLPRPGFRRIGILTPFVPWPLAHGGAVRMHALLRELAARFDVYLFAFREAETVASVEPLRAIVAGIGWVTKPRYREPRWASILPAEVREYESAPMRRLLAAAVKEHGVELLQVEYTHLARYGGDILVAHDVTYDLYAQIHRRNRTLASWWDWFRWRRFERRALRRYRRIIAMSEKDRQELGAPHVTVIPNGVDLARFQPQPEREDRRLLFVGSFRHFPNLLAYRFLLDEVMPLLSADVRLTVVAGPQPELYAPETPADPRVERLGFVADVASLYAACNVALAPTLVSAGTNVKVLEAMACGRAVVSTPSGCNGIPVTHEGEVLVAEGAHAFARAIERLLAAPALRREMGARARRFVEARFGWGTLGQMQVEVVRQLLPDRIRIRQGMEHDVPAVRRIQADALPSSRWDAAQYLAHEFYVALYDCEVAGFIVARKTAPDEREILNLAVAGEYRGLGIGGRLLRQLVWSGERGDVFLEVRESNVGAQKLYERVGFVRTGLRPRYYEDPVETAVIMRIQVV